MFAIIYVVSGISFQRSCLTAKQNDVFHIQKLNANYQKGMLKNF